MDNPEKILVLNNEFEANLMDQILKEKGIPFIIRTFHDLAYDGLWATQSSWGQLLAPPEYKEEILQIYSEMANTPFDESHDTEK